MSVWYDKAEKVILGGIGPFRVGKPKIVWHTTEGSTVAGAIAAYRASNAYPHFTVGEDLKVYQHAPIDEAVTTLAHPSGTPETNYAHAIQIEIVGFAADSGEWSDRRYAALAKLSRWIEREANVKRRAAADFDNPRKLGGEEFVKAAGHVGHVHAPGNNHTDPGTGFKIRRVLDKE